MAWEHDGWILGIRFSPDRTRREMLDDGIATRASGMFRLRPAGCEAIQRRGIGPQAELSCRRSCRAVLDPGRHSQ
jgi:hypothetical protein